MKVINENYGDGLYKLTLGNVITHDDKSIESLKNIIRVLTKGEKLFFEFSCEDFFLDADETIVYRKSIPLYMESNGMYKVKFKLDETRFRSIGYLPISMESYNQIVFLWRYFEGLVFFVPMSAYNWEDFDNGFIRNRAEVSAIDFIRKKYTNSVFIKGHDGDNLIFIYGENFDKSLIKEVISIAEK